MRMRRKRHLDERIEDCLNYIIMRKSTCIYKLPEEERYDLIDYNEVFGNDNPVYLEIGCGKGGFLIEMAKRHPDRNYIGVEVVGNVIISAAEKANECNLKNIRFINAGAELLTYILPKGSIEDLFLNFSCPFPKKQYENNRLTYKLFLDRYKVFLKKTAKIILKTDNTQFFDYSLCSLEQNGFNIEFKTYDLYSLNDEENIQTEYEKKFVEQGMKINKLIASIK